MLEIYAAAIFFVVSCVAVLRAGLYLPAFFVLCYSLPFLPLIPALFFGTVNFWTGEDFSYSIEAPVVAAISVNWLVSSLGVILACIAQKNQFYSRVDNVNNKSERDLKLIIKKSGRHVFFYAVVCFLTVWRLIVGGDAGDGFTFGGELIVCNVLLFLILVAFGIKSGVLYILLSGVVAAYVISQLAYGDRDFFTIIVALMLLFFAKNVKGCGGMLKLAIIAVVVVSCGALVAMLRMSVAMSLGEFANFFFYNSWTATIQPVLLMLDDEFEIGPTLFGKSYMDLLFSIPPSFVYGLFDLQKPIQIDNPAEWFYVEGMGGMHAIGVAWRNFGLFGVAFQCFLSVFFLSKVEKLAVLSNSFWRCFFYLVVASQLMHTTWYSLVSMVNALVLFFVIYVIFNAEKIFRRVCR